MNSGKITELKNGFGFIQPDQGRRRVFFHRTKLARDLRFDELHEGDQVEYESEETERGLTATIVRRAGTAASVKHPDSTSGKGKHALSQDHFLNPYNFVRYLERADDPNDEPAVKLLGRCTPPPHDRWVGLSGRITCTLKAVTPIFVSDSEDISLDSENPQHKHFRFFTINGRKTIPASSLRGSARSIFELITNSCFSSFTGSRLSYRLDAKDARRLIPARIDPTDDGHFDLRLLCGTAILDAEYPPKELYGSAVRLYHAEKPTGRKTPRPLPPPPSVNLKGNEHGDQCWALLLRMKFPPSWRVVEITSSREDAERLMKQAQKKATSHSEFEVQQGWLCVTNQNTDNKHSERFFFADDTQGNVQSIRLPDDVREKYEDLIFDYQRRHAPLIDQWQNQGKDVRELSKPFAKDPKEPHKREMAFSRFILNLNRKDGKVQGGELVYAMLRGRGKNMRVEFIAPVSVPRVAYEHTIADLLPHDLKHCDNQDNLCPACRTFGWVHGERDQEGAFSGRVRFSNAHLKEGMENPQQPLRLAILGSPKPTTTRFYLVGPDGKPSQMPQSDKTVGYDGNDGKNRIRGRKLYRHHTPTEKEINSDTKSDQNRTIEDAEGVGAEFAFTVDFENLALVELGALLWALEMDNKGYHRLGYGKPLGLGSVQASIERVEILNPISRYKKLTESGYQPITDWHQQYVNKFVKAAEARWTKPFDAIPSIQDLLALIEQIEPSLPVHYPYSPEYLTQGSFEWFVGNKRDKGPKIELALASEDKGLPFIDRSGQVYH